MERVWKKIPNFSRYEASSDGLIRSIDYKRTGKAVVLKPAIAKDGYLQTMIKSDSGKYCSWKIHKFIAITFLGDRVGELEINHKNCIKTDNRVDNLEWVTRSENIKHAYRHGCLAPKRGSINGNSKLTDEQVAEIRE